YPATIQNLMPLRSALSISGPVLSKRSSAPGLYPTGLKRSRQDAAATQTGNHCALASNFILHEGVPLAAQRMVLRYRTGPYLVSLLRPLAKVLTVQNRRTWLLLLFPPILWYETQETSGLKTECDLQLRNVVIVSRLRDTSSLCPIAQRVGRDASLSSNSGKTSIGGNDSLQGFLERI